ncbi:MULTISPECIES: formimidoylglutamate deiminase [unclassified Geodermatophilus]
MTVLFAPHAHLPGGVRADVLLEVDGGRFTAVRPGVPPAEVPAGARRLPGVVAPGFADAHSHAFHRALRGRTPAGGGTFWTWREAAYDVAGRIDPDRYLELARAAYAEMALAGVSTVGEFHYLHHAPGGRRYADPNAMAEALRQAAADAGVRLTLLDTAYLAGGLSGAGHDALAGAQLRFGDGDVHRWAERVAALRGSAGFRVGAAVHSVRAVPAADLPVVVAAARGGLGGADRSPLHVHVSEQPAENEACRAFYGRTPTRLLADAGVWDAAATAVHATHLTGTDVALLGGAGATACLCPTTERDLADGIGPARALLDAGAALSLGSDQHAVADLLEEARAMEAHERLVSLRRGRFTPAQLLAALTAHASLGWDDAGRIEPGARADLVALRTDTVGTAGALPNQVLLTASRADVDTVWVDGVPVVEGGRHRLGDVGALLGAAVARVWAP